jgi:hypothetical protein
MAIFNSYVKLPEGISMEYPYNIILLMILMLVKHGEAIINKPYFDS